MKAWRNQDAWWVGDNFNWMATTLNTQQNFTTFLTIYWSTWLWFIMYYFHVDESSHTLFLSHINYKLPLSTVVNFGVKLISYTLTTLLDWSFQWWCRWDQDWKETERDFLQTMYCWHWQEQGYCGWDGQDSMVEIHMQPI